MESKKYKDKKIAGISSLVRLITVISLVGVIYKRLKKDEDKGKSMSKVSYYFDKIVDFVDEVINEDDEVEEGEIVKSEKKKKENREKKSEKRKVRIVNLSVNEKKVDKKALTDRQDKILKLIKSNGNLTMSEIRDHIDGDLSERTLRRDLTTLSNSKQIKKSGNTKGAVYSLLD